MKPRKSHLSAKRLKTRLYTVALTVVSAVIVAILSLAWDIYFYSDSADIQADAAIVLGAAVWGEEPSPVFRERINHAVHLYKNEQVENLIFTGGKGDSTEQAEAIVARDYAIKQGVSELDILTETQSRTTFQNLTNAKQVAQNHHFKSFLIVSDPLHMKRSILIAQSLGLTAYPSPTPTTRYKSLSNKLPFLLRETYFYIHYVFGRWIGLPQ